MGNCSCINSGSDPNEFSIDGQRMKDLSKTVLIIVYKLTNLKLILNLYLLYSEPNLVLEDSR